MSRCRADPACPYPAREGFRLCAQHELERRLPFTLHETSAGGRVRGAGEFKDYSIVGARDERNLGPVWAEQLRCARISPQRKLRFKISQYKREIVREPVESKKRGSKTMPEEVIVPSPKRYRLPDTRRSVTHKFTVGGVRCYAIVGLYEDGAPGELFLQTDKQGSFEHGMVDAWAILFSMLLQHRVPLPAILAKFKHVKFQPSGVTGSKVGELRFADSILDYLVRWMELRFLDAPMEISQAKIDEAFQVARETNNCVVDLRRPEEQERAGRELKEAFYPDSIDAQRCRPHGSTNCHVCHVKEGNR